jgi:hypothetical protein
MPVWAYAKTIGQLISSAYQQAAISDFNFNPPGAKRFLVPRPTWGRHVNLILILMHTALASDLV